MRAMQRLLVYVFPLCICSLLTAQDPSELKPGLFDLTPLASYRSRMSFSFESSVPGRSSRVVLDASPAYGFAYARDPNSESKNRLFSMVILIETTDQMKARERSMKFSTVAYLGNGGK